MRSIAKRTAATMNAATRTGPRAAGLGRPPVELLEPRQLFAAGTGPFPPPAPQPPPPTSPVARAYDGTGNNAAHPLWGSTGQPLLRLAAAAYADGVAAPAGASRPSARAVSTAVVAHGEADLPNASRLSAFAYLWGQFVDHDLDLTTAASPAEAFPVPVPVGDPSFDPAGTGTKTIPLSRSAYAAGTGVTTAAGVAVPRQQVNSITAFLDAGMVYGSDPVRAAALRLGTGGLMKTSAGGLLPYNTAGLPNDSLGGPAAALFLAGDVRANENIELTAVQTLFVREHNRRAGQIAAGNPKLTDEQVFQAARRLVTAEIQQITYEEFLPALLGRDAVRPYAGYKPAVNPGISNEFSTAAFRLGHSMLANDVEFLANDGTAVRDEIPLAQAFFSPSLVAATGVDPILKYLASSNSEEIDIKVVDGLQNFLFGAPGSGGLDLASLNIQRGRDHGLADYNTTRAAVGLPRVTSFAQITSDAALAASLQSLYGTVDNVDLWVGGLAEDHAAGSNVGPTFQKILVDQFTRARDGDRFWYQSSLNGDEMRVVQGVRLADVIRANTGVSNLQPDVFVFNPTIDGQVFEDADGDGRLGKGERGLAGRRVDLVDGTGVIARTTTTDQAGRFVVSGIDLGSYTLVVETPAGWTTTARPTGTLAVTRGGRIATVSVAQRRAAPPPAVVTTVATTASAKGAGVGVASPLAATSAWAELARAFMGPTGARFL
jgi:peroxidase